MATVTSRTITIKGEPVRSERLATAVAIKPGYLLELAGTQAAPTVQAHSTAGGNVYGKMIALENDLAGDGISTSYAVSSTIQIGHFRPGDEVYMHLLNGESVHFGDPLESGADGTVRELDAETSAGTIKIGCLVGVALEDVDMSGSTGVDPTGGWIRVLII